MATSDRAWPSWVCLSKRHEIGLIPRVIQTSPPERPHDDVCLAAKGRPRFCQTMSTTDAQPLGSESTHEPATDGSQVQGAQLDLDSRKFCPWLATPAHRSWVISPRASNLDSSYVR